MIDPGTCALYYPATAKGPKRRLWEALGEDCGAVTTDAAELADMAGIGFVPIVGCYPEVRALVALWRLAGRPFLYRDHGYFGRADCRASAAGHYRWHWNRPQLGEVGECPPDRFAALGVPVAPWREAGGHIVIAAPGRGYSAFHRLTGNWTAQTAAQLRRFTDRPLLVREKGAPTSLADDLAGAHALVTHGSIAAVEAVAMGCPVFVEPVSAAASVGRTSLAQIEAPAMPDRAAWLNALAYAQFTDAEMLDGTLWAMLPDMPGNGRSRPARGKARPASSLAVAPA